MVWIISHHGWLAACADRGTAVKTIKNAFKADKVDVSYPVVDILIVKGVSLEGRDFEVQVERRAIQQD